MPKPIKLIFGLILGAIIFLAGYVADRHQAPALASTAINPILYYTCPMHPQYKSDRPGNAPCCGMRLEPVYAQSPGVVQVGTGQQQLLGIRTGEVKRAPVSHMLRVPGRIAVDESRAYRLIAAVDGWIREMGPNSAGAPVKQNQVLASYYTKDFLASQQTFLYALSTNEQLQNGSAAGALQRLPNNLNLQLNTDTLRGLGMSDLQLDELRRTRTSANLIHIYSPVNGFVVTRNVSPGQRFDKGTEMYRIADLDHVWVMADLFEKDREFARPGAMATIRYQGREFSARMSDVLQFDPQLRTLKARFDAANPGNILRPDMFVDVELHVDLPATVTVPSDAILDSGRRKTVYVEQGNGVFQPRPVEIGWRLGDHVQIVRGLEPGERIVVSGNFLIDSESRMKPAPMVAERAATVKDPVCGMDIEPGKLQAKHGGKTYYFCSSHCKETFESDPAKYTGAQRGPV